MSQVPTADAAFAWVRMQRQVDTGLILMVEGDDEEAILSGHLDAGTITMLVLGGKANVLAAARMTEQARVRGVFALVDRDLDDLTGLSMSYPGNVAASHGYDLVTDIYMNRQDLFERAIRVHGKAVVNIVESTAGMTILQLVLRLCLKIAALRLVNFEMQLGLNLRNFPFERIMGLDYQPKEISKILEVANVRSQPTVSFETIEKALERAMNRIGQDVRFCGGHDLIGAAAALLRKGGARGVSARSLAASVYTAIDCETVSVLPLREGISNWASNYSRTAFTCGWAQSS